MMTIILTKDGRVVEQPNLYPFFDVEDRTVTLITTESVCVTGASDLSEIAEIHWVNDEEATKRMSGYSCCGQPMHPVLPDEHGETLAHMCDRCLKWRHALPVGDLRRASVVAQMTVWTKRLFEWRKGGQS